VVVSDRQPEVGDRHLVPDLPRTLVLRRRALPLPCWRLPMRPTCSASSRPAPPSAHMPRTCSSVRQVAPGDGTVTYHDLTPDATPCPL